MGMIAYLLRVDEAALAAYKNDSGLLKQRVAAAAEEDPCLYEIDHAWDGIIYLLTGNNASDNNTHPLAKVLFSGQLVDERLDMGYGPAHYLEPHQVRQLQAELEGIAPGSLRSRFDAQAMKMAGVYPNAWDYEGTDDYLIEYYETIQEVFAAAAQEGQGIITFLA